MSVSASSVTASTTSIQGEVDSEGRPVLSLVDRLVQHVGREMADTWRRDDQLLQKFFPIEPAPDSKFSPQARKELYNDNQNQKRWKGIPSKPKSVSRLCTPLTRLMNTILHRYGISRRTRLFLNTHSESNLVVSTPPSPMSPSLFLAGAGSEFANAAAQLPRAVTQSGLCPIEVILDTDNHQAARDRLAVNIHLMFQNQDNRRFAHGLVITEKEVTVYMFDHSGSVASRPSNYHQDPEQFWAIITGLASDKTERTGFDSSIFGDGRCAKIRTFEPTQLDSSKATHYTLKANLFQFHSLVGRGTICWIVRGPDDSDSTFAIKDAWIAPEELDGRESEATLLRHVQTRGVVAGVVQIHHSEEVRRGLEATDLDTVFRNRRVEASASADRKLDRVHTRVVMDAYYNTLDRFTTRKELLLAFHDAVLGMQDLNFSRDNNTLSTLQLIATSTTWLVSCTAILVSEIFSSILRVQKATVAFSSTLTMPSGLGILLPTPQNLKLYSFRPVYVVSGMTFPFSAGHMAFHVSERPEGRSSPHIFR